MIIQRRKGKWRQNAASVPYRPLGDRFAEMQTLASHHLNDLANTHKNEITRLEDSSKSQVENHTKLVNEIKNRNENERHQHIGAIDSLKVENKKLNETISKLQLQSQENIVHITRLESDLKNLIVERDSISTHLAEQEKKWLSFNDKTLVSDDVLTKIYDTPKFDLLINKFNSMLIDSMDKKFFEIQDTIRLIKIEKQAETQDE